MGVCQLGCLSASCGPGGPGRRRPRAEAATGGGLYLDVSMFSSLKLLQCSVTFLETTGERGVEGGLESGWPLSLLAGRSGRRLCWPALTVMLTETKCTKRLAA